MDELECEFELISDSFASLKVVGPRTEDTLAGGRSAESIAMYSSSI